VHRTPGRYKFICKIAIVLSCVHPKKYDFHHVQHPEKHDNIFIELSLNKALGMSEKLPSCVQCGACLLPMVKENN
jgi:hypothetical protein